MKQLDSRQFVIGGVFLLIGIIFLIRLFLVQVIDTHYKLDASNNVKRHIVKYPARGLIYDRNNDLLVFNEAAYDLMVIPKQLPKKFDTTAFCDLLGMSHNDFVKKITKAKDYSYYKASTFLKEISTTDYAKIQEQLYNYPSFYVQRRTLRKYPRKTAAHILGYVGEASPRIIEETPYYKPGDHIGISGIERQYEEMLRGKRGVEIVLVDVFNREKGKYMNGQFDSTAVSGSNLQLTIDNKLQAYGEALLQNKKGSIVAIEPETGEILALVSSPNYDPNLLVGRARSDNYRNLSFDTLKPLFNRALMAAYPPGSIFKSINALIGQEEKVLFPNTYYHCNYGFYYAGGRMRCHAHRSPVNLQYSIETSCNTYYCRVFKSIIDKYPNSEEGYEVWRKYITAFGLGKKTNIDLPGELNGFVPEASYYDRYYSSGRWNANTILSLAIGQGELGFTPIQMAQMTAAIANKGYYYTPHIVKKIDGKSIENIDNAVIKYNIPIKREHFIPVVEAMGDVVEKGTGRMARIDSIRVGGKTGTIQNPHGDDHSAFIAFAPLNNPKIAIAVYVEKGVWGSRWAAPIAGLMIEQYLTDSISNQRKWIEKRMLEGVLIPIKEEKDAE